MSNFRKMVEEISEVIADIGNEWECGFIENMINWTGDFTLPQEETIEKLYIRACNGNL